jgi:phosphoglycerate dehydrogenase-like enzyme
MKPKVLYLPTPRHTARVFLPETYARLLAEFEVDATDADRRVTPEEFAERVVGCDAVVTGWGSPSFTPAVWERADRLRLIAHSAGSVKFLFAREDLNRHLLPRGITVASANAAIALNVAEYTIGAMIMGARRFPEHVAAMRSGAWGDAAVPHSARYLRGAVVGLLSASTVGREVIRLLPPFDVTILVHDPYLSEEEAKRLGVERVSLADLFARSDIVSLHAPSIPETRHLVGTDALRALRDGALLINTSRGSVLDHDALTREASTGRIQVILDVTDPEPLPPDHPLRSLPNVALTPHQSGAGAYGYARIGAMTLQALRDGLAGRPVAGAVRLADYDRLA